MKFSDGPVDDDEEENADIDGEEPDETEAEPESPSPPRRARRRGKHVGLVIGAAPVARADRSHRGHARGGKVTHLHIHHHLGPSHFHGK
jgi:hypothetical protein